MIIKPKLYANQKFFNDEKSFHISFRLNFYDDFGFEDFYFSAQSLGKLLVQHSTFGLVPLFTAGQQLEQSPSDRTCLPSSILE